MRHLPYKIFSKFIAISIIASLLSLVISIVFAMFVPQTYEARDTAALELEKNKIYTKEELIQADKEAERIIEEWIRISKEAHKNKTPKELIQEAKLHAIYVSWIPWLIIPFILPISHFLWGVVLLLIPIALIPTGVFLFTEVILFSVCLYLGNKISNTWIRKSKKSNTS